MPISVLKVSKADDNHIEVIGEFWDSTVAQRVADFLQQDDKDNNCDYVIEAPNVPEPDGGG